MIRKLSSKQERIHHRALKIARLHGKVEWQLIEVLQEAEVNMIHRALRYSSVFKYAIGALGLSEPVAYAFISVARKAKQVPALQEAIRDQRISVSKASRMISCIGGENAGDLIEFARSHSSRELDFEVARRNPKAAKSERAKPITNDQVEITITVSRSTYEKYKRAQSLAAQTGNPGIDLGGVSDLALDAWLDKYDPVRRAERALTRQKRKNEREQVSELCPNRVSDLKVTRMPAQKTRPGGRIRLKALEKHVPVAAAGGQCTFIDENGQRCTNDRWLHLHHIRPVSHGGSNDPDNLTVLCSFHHELVHQLSLPIDGQITWLRSRMREYVA